MTRRAVQAGCDRRASPLRDSRDPHVERRRLPVRIWIVVFLLAVVGAILLTAGSGSADPDLGNVPRHRHWIATESGQLVQVGPRPCDNPNLQQAFNQFHNNLHVATGSSIGPAAPGLHNFRGGEILFSGC
jgi:hypothetical protein